MAKTATAGPKIVQDKQAWGVRLRLQPFPDSDFASMEISADIAAPKSAGRNAEIKVWFSGTSLATPLRATDFVIWMEAMRAIQDETRKVAEKMKKAK